MVCHSIASCAVPSLDRGRGTRLSAGCRPLRISSCWSGRKVDDAVCSESGSNSREEASFQPADIAGKFDHRDLHAQADAEVRLAVCRRQCLAAGEHAFACRVRRNRRAPGSRRSSSSACRLTLVIGERLPNRSIRSRRSSCCRIAGMTQRLGHRQIGVVQLRVLADQADHDSALVQLWMRSSIAFHSLQVIRAVRRTASAPGRRCPKNDFSPA